MRPVIRLANFKIRVLMVQDLCLPPPVQVVGKGSCSDETQPIEFPDLAELNCYIAHLKQYP